MQTPSRKVNPLKKMFMWRSPRTPLEYSNVLEDIENKIANSEPVPYVAFEQLLKKLANSARLKYIWADMDKAMYLVKTMQKVGYQLDGSCYRSLLQVAVEECCRGDMVKTELMGILNQVETSPDIEVDLDMLNLLLGGLAGLASQGRASLKDGMALIEQGKAGGLVPNLVTWAGLLDILVGEASVTDGDTDKLSRLDKQAEEVINAIRAEKMSSKRTLDKWLADARGLIWSNARESGSSDSEFLSPSDRDRRRPKQRQGAGRGGRRGGWS